METPLATVRAIYKAKLKDVGTPGILTLMENKLMFMPNDPMVASAFKLDVAFSNIKGQKSSKEGSKVALLNLIQDETTKGGNYIFEFENFQERNTCRDIVVRILGAYQSSLHIQAAQRLPETSQATPTITRGNQLSQAEMECRMKLLQDNSGLQKLHKELVFSGIVTDDEFWAKRKNLIEASKRERQWIGMKSEMLSDVRPMIDSRTNLVTFNLSAEIIHQIFTEKPAVHRAFLMNVPHKMSESHFWAKYCRAIHLRRTSNSATAAAEAAEDDDLAIFLKEDDILANEVCCKIMDVDPTIDVETDYADDYMQLPGRGIVWDGSEDNTDADNNELKQILIKDINRHAAVVVEGSIIAFVGDTMTIAKSLRTAKQDKKMTTKSTEARDQRRCQRVQEIVGIDDLQAPYSLPFAPLYIKDPQRYFDSQKNATGVEGSNPRQDYAYLAQEVMEIKKRGLKDPIINPDMALKVLNNLTESISSSQPSKDSKNYMLDSVPSNTREDLLEHWTIIEELLWHFWNSYPITTTSPNNKVTT